MIRIILNNLIFFLLQSDELLVKRCSPTPSNPLISDCSPSNSGDEDDNYRTLNFEPDESLPFYNGESHYADSSGPVPVSNGVRHPSNPNLRQQQEEPGRNDYANSQSVQNQSNGGSITDLLVPEVSKNSAYVKWTSLKMDSIMGGTTPVNGKPPYCQVGILLEQ